MPGIGGQTEEHPAERIYQQTEGNSIESKKSYGKGCQSVREGDRERYECIWFSLNVTGIHENS